MSHAFTVARKDVADAVRSSTLLAVVGLFVLLTAAVVSVPPVFGVGDTTFGDAVGAVVQLSGLLLPMVGLLVAVQSITAERESGSLRMLLSLPPSRGEVVAGKLLGRGAVIGLAGAAGVVTTGLVGLVAYADFSVGALLALGASSVLLGLSFVGVAIGLSAASSTPNRATALAVGFYLTTVVLWTVLMGALRVVAGRLGLLAEGANPAWLRAIAMLPPNRAFPHVFDGLRSGRLLGESAVPSPTLALLVTLAWVVLPPVLGYLRFRRADLG